jgi:hypothetical protein
VEKRGEDEKKKRVFVANSQTDYTVIDIIVVAYTCNPSYSESGNLEDCGPGKPGHKHKTLFEK